MIGLRRLLIAFTALLALSLAGISAWLLLAPPALLQVGSGYAAKIVCSSVFLSGRDPGEVLALDVQAPGHPLLRLMDVDVDRQAGQVRAALLGVFAAGDASYREGLGCAAGLNGDVAIRGTPEALPTLADADAPWPQGERGEADQAIAARLSDTTLTGPGMRAVVVIRGGQIVGEAYGSRFSAATPLLGWSMTKTVNAAIIGTLLNQGRLSLMDRALLPQWQKDDRKAITLAHLLAMEDGLAFGEDYGAVNDVTRMLYLESDMAGFAASAPPAAKPGTQFNYSSGTAVLLSRIWMDRIGGGSQALAYPRQALFEPLGMASAVMETDASGTFVGSSYMYATARDWARLALFLLRDGVWNGERMLPEGFVAMMSEPNGTSGGHYSKMQTWLPGGGVPELPADTFFLQGHDGQTIAVVPSLDLAVVRLGLTPASDGFDVLPLVREVVSVSR